jgi:CheY-like chemotaxis protein
MKGRPPLVLVVDDFADAREMYVEYLEFAGFRSAQAQNGEEAIAQARERGPAVVLMDLAMPVMDGWEATRRLKSDPRTRHIPVIAVTGHALAGDAERARRAGCDGVLAKPCLPEDLVREVRRILASVE